MSRHDASRHERILALVRERGYVANDELARLFGVTVQTIRREVNALAGAGRLARHHGGVGLVSSVENLDYAERQSLHGHEKRAIARALARAIPNGASLFINVGTTTEAAARALLHHVGLSVVTNNLNVATMLARNAGFKVTVVGGMVRNRDGGILGSTASDMIASFRVDFGIIGISGIDADGSLLDYDAEEIRVAQAIVRHARRTYLVADHSKFARRPMIRLGGIAEVAALFTDRTPPRGIVSMMQQHGVELHLADQPG